MPVHPEMCDAVSLMVSELATNAVLHGGTDYVVDVDVRPTSVRVDVSDVGAGMPVRTDALPTASRGRGLTIVDGIADSWGVVHATAELGKSVWFELQARVAPLSPATTATTATPLAPATTATPLATAAPAAPPA